MTSSTSPMNQTPPPASPSKLLLQWMQTPAGQQTDRCEIEAPGCTVGSWVGNGLALDDAPNTLAGVQAVLRLHGNDQWELHNLSAHTPPLYNDQAMAYRQRAVLRAGDELAFSPANRFRVLAVNGEQEPLPMDEASAEAVDDLFADLLGSGTVPVGAMPELSERHPFELGSTARQPQDPLGDLPKAMGLDRLTAAEHQDPLKPFQAKLDDSQASAPCITDSHPSILPRQLPPASHEAGKDILDSLAPAKRDDDTEARRRTAQQNHASALHSSLRQP